MEAYYQQPVLELVLDSRLVDRCRESQRFFKIAVSYLHLLVRNARGAGLVLSTACDVENVALNIDLDVFRRHAGQLNLDDPTVRSLVNIRRRIPKLAASHVFGRANKLKMAIDRFGHRRGLFLTPKGVAA